MATQNKFGLTATRQIRFALKADKLLEVEAKAISQMIAQWERVENNRTMLFDSLSEKMLYPETIHITNKCIDEISVALDQMWAEITDAQRTYAKHVKRVQEFTMSIKD